LVQQRRLVMAAEGNGGGGGRGGGSLLFSLNSGIPLVSARRRISAMPLANTFIVSIRKVHIARKCY
jgi:hypothetical protein